MHIGIDVGGTNTDAVLVEGNRILSAQKCFTTEDIISGIKNSIQGLSKGKYYSTNKISAVMLGTTHFINAILQEDNLAEVAVIRLCLPSSKSLYPMIDWPEHLKNKLSNTFFYAHGGYEYDGSTISELRKHEIVEIVNKIKKKNIKNIVVSCVFSPVKSEMEKEVAAVITQIYPESNITISSKIGSLGLLERENSAILNASLLELAPKIIDSVESAIKELNLKCPLYFTQNDGTLINKEYAKSYPVMTIASGPTNSMRGASYLTGETDAIVIDIGGTTSDCGILVKGFPREALGKIDIAGVRTNFRMPDTLSIALGGGSKVKLKPLTIGPESVGYNLANEGLVFGGQTLTATDIAVSYGNIDLGDKNKVSDITEEDINSVSKKIRKILENIIDRIKTTSGLMPVILVGGGAILVKDNLNGASKIITPKYFDVANAIGAAIAEVGGEVDQVFYLENVGGRDKAISIAISNAKTKAIDAGADKDSLRVVNIEEYPIAYLPGSATRIKTKVVGKLIFTEN
ncbi:MAG: hydantoinase/oxoprolinase family protein [bacterium]|nr:hydantoinase/oxoprolinase family protein [bacterium]